MPHLIVIDDPADPRIHAYRDIRERDLVGRRRSFVAEGTVVLEKLVASTTHRAASLLIADKRRDATERYWSRLPDGVPVFVASQPVVDAIAGFPLHRGVLAIGYRMEDRTPDRLLAETAARAASVDVLLLCGIANHDNMGGIFRNAAAFGVGAILLDADCCDPLYRKAIRVSVGAALTMPYARLDRADDPLELLERHGFAPVALSPAGALALSDWRPGARHGVLLGAEGPGLDPALLARVPTLTIPMTAGFDSLNVATTSGIVLHHLSNRR